MNKWIKDENGDLIGIGANQGRIYKSQQDSVWAVMASGSLNPLKSNLDTEQAAQDLIDKIAEKLRDGGDVITVIDDFFQ